MCRYRITVTISDDSACVDGGGWVVGMTWRKSVILEPEDRARAIALRDLLNHDKPVMDGLGYPMWDRCYGMCNSQCWQWELVTDHSTAVNAIMRAADVEWPEDGLPDIDQAIVSINLAIV